MIAPSMLSSDFANLQRDIEMINRSEAGLFHIDVMDGMFVPNISFGFPVIEKIAKYALKPLAVHLMIVDPDRYITRFQECGATWISVHLEACNHLHRTIQLIKGLNVKAGVALNPHSPVLLLEDILKDLDYVVIMSVNPGFGGQSFIPESIQKVKKLKAMIREQGASTLIEVDGGVDLNNIRSLKEAGADIFVAGNTVFKAADPVQMISQLKNA